MLRSQNAELQERLRTVESNFNKLKEFFCGIDDGTGNQTSFVASTGKKPSDDDYCNSARKPDSVDFCRPSSQLSASLRQSLDYKGAYA